MPETPAQRAARIAALSRITDLTQDDGIIAYDNRSFWAARGDTPRPAAIAAMLTPPNDLRSLNGEQGGQRLSDILPPNRTVDIPLPAASLAALPAAEQQRVRAAEGLVMFILEQPADERTPVAARPGVPAQPVAGRPPREPKMAFALLASTANEYFRAGDVKTGTTLVNYAIRQAQLLNQPAIATQFETYKAGVARALGTNGRPATLTPRTTAPAGGRSMAPAGDGDAVVSSDQQQNFAALVAAAEALPVERGRTGLPDAARAEPQRGTPSLSA